MNGRFLLLVAATALFAHLWTHARPATPSAKTAVVAGCRVPNTTNLRKPVVREPNLPARTRTVAIPRPSVVGETAPIAETAAPIVSTPAASIASIPAGSIAASPVGQVSVGQVSVEQVSVDQVSVDQVSVGQVWTTETSPFVVPTCLVGGQYRVVTTNGVIGQIEIPTVNAVGPAPRMDFAQTHMNGVRVFWIRLQESGAIDGESNPIKDSVPPIARDSAAVIRAPVMQEQQEQQAPQVQTKSRKPYSLPYFCGDEEILTSTATRNAAGDAPAVAAAAVPAVAPADADAPSDGDPIDVVFAADSPVDESIEQTPEVIHPDDYQIDRPAPRKFDFSFLEGTSRN
jgi:hypothetical protein